MKQYFTALAWSVILLTTPSVAKTAYKANTGEDQKAVLAFKKRSVDGGARFVLSNVETVFVAGILRDLPAPPPNVTAIILEEGKPARYSTAPLAEIDKMLGGNGQHEIEFQNAPNPDRQEIDLDLKNGKTPKKIFVADASRLVQPKDGLWEAQLVSTDIVDCPAQVAGAVQGQDLSPKSKQLSFSTPFRPTDISAQFGQFDWDKTAENRWESILLEQKQGPVSFKKSISIDLISETEMSFTSKIRMTLPPEATMVLGSGANCRATIVGKYTHSAE